MTVRMEERYLGGRPAFAYGVGLFAITLGVFAGLYALWLSGHHETYVALTRFWGIDAWTRPFLDLSTVLSWGECQRLGVDILKTNPCGPIGGPLSYGPPLLALPFGVRDTTLIALPLSLAFLTALPLVLRPRSWEEWMIAVAASLSTATLFAVERCNLDLFEFLLVALSGPLTASGGTGRLFSYALYYLGGALKFYPFALLLLVLRERPRIALLLGALSAIAIAFYAWHYWSALAAIKSMLPQFEYDSDTFGAALLPYGLADELGFSDTFGLWAALVLFAGFGALALHLAVRWMRYGPAPDWNRANFHFLLAGAIVMAGCFVAQSNIDYRAIFLLFMLPGLFDLRNAAGMKFLKRTFGLAIWAVIFCMWGEFFRRALEKILNVIDPGRGDDSPWNIVSLAFFAGRELVWWGLMAVAFAVILVFVLTSPLGKAARAKFAGMRAKYASPA